MCFTGRLNRLINCLNGFDDRVDIKISDSDQIANIISKARENNTDLEEIKKYVEKEMEERGFTPQEIDEWISYIE